MIEKMFDKIRKHKDLHFLLNNRLEYKYKIHRVVKYFYKYSVVKTYLSEVFSKIPGSIDFQNENGYTVLMKLCTMAKNIEDIEFLFQYNPNLNLKSNCGWTALMFAVKSMSIKNNPEQFFMFLISNGADVGEINNLGDNALSILLKEISSYKKLVGLFPLLMCGIEIENKNIFGMSPLFYAIKISETTYGLRALKVLLITDDDLSDALIYACKNSKKSAIDEIIAKVECGTVIHNIINLYNKNEIHPEILNKVVTYYNCYNDLDDTILYKLYNYFDRKT